MPVWPFSVFRFILYLGCLIAAGIFIAINKIIWGPITDIPYLLFFGVINYSLSVYLLFKLIGIEKKVNEKEREIVRKDIEKLISSSNISFHEVSENDNKENINEAIKIDEFHQNMKKAQTSWKTIKHNKRNDYQKYFSYQSKCKTSSYLIDLFSMFLSLCIGFTLINFSKVGFLMWLINVAFFLTTTVTIILSTYLMKQYRKYGMKIHPDLFNNFSKIIDNEVKKK